MNQEVRNHTCEGERTTTVESHEQGKSPHTVQRFRIGTVLNVNGLRCEIWIGLWVVRLLCRTATTNTKSNQNSSILIIISLCSQTTTKTNPKKKSSSPSSPLKIKKQTLCEQEIWYSENQVLILDLKQKRNWKCGSSKGFWFWEFFLCCCWLVTISILEGENRREKEKKKEDEQKREGRGKEGKKRSNFFCCRCCFDFGSFFFCFNLFF